MAATAIDPCQSDRCRRVATRFGEYLVPRHIVRLDGERVSGWQVRWEGTRYFADGANGGPDAAFDAACQYLRKVWRPIPKITNRNTSDDNPHPGVAVIRVESRGRACWYAESRHPRRGSPRRFYIGTDQTYSENRAKVALKRAIQHRKAVLASIPVPIR